MGSSKKSRKKNQHTSISENSSDKVIKAKRKKRKREISSSSDSSSSDSDYHKQHKLHRQERKEKKKLKKLKKKLKKLEKQKSCPTSTKEKNDCIPGPSNAEDVKVVKKVMVPVTKEEWEKQQSEIRREFDPTTGRSRLVRGSGEIVEEIVSKERQKEINKAATIGDGIYYQKQTGLL